MSVVVGCDGLEQRLLSVGQLPPGPRTSVSTLAAWPPGRLAGADGPRFAGAPREGAFVLDGRGAAEGALLITGRGL
ncbi:hypothetical protein [Streptomyces sp. C]|uniref:hypothetical protein n=1 Tax=Streptomyces sp. C TaxID=253839 RepID=UPI0001B58184|nr:hypothetical protein [Streptomyces sp. C]EFL12786.1 predicted protein [Streptomyces sp. C]